MASRSQGALKKTSDTPVVFITAYNDEQTLKAATTTAPYGYLLKPFDDRSLTVTIKIALECYAADRHIRLYGVVMNAAAVGIVIARSHNGAAAVVTQANDAYTKMVGRSIEELASLPLLLAHDAQDVVVGGIHDAIQQGKDGSGVYLASSANGTTFWSSVVVAPVVKRDGSGAGTVLFHLDVTNQRDTERALAHKQRLELLARLAAGIAHDFNNARGPIMALAEVAGESDFLEESRSDLSEIIQTAQVGARLTRKLLLITMQPSPLG